MKRFFTVTVIPYLLACILYNTDFLDAYLYTLVFLFLLCLIRRKNRTHCIIAVVASILALILSSNAYSIAEKSFYPLLDKPITLKCVVTDTPAFSEYGISFTAQMISADSISDSFRADEKVLVQCQGKNVSKPIRYGDVLEFKTKLCLPDTSMNDGCFSYRQYLNSRGIFVVCNTCDFALTNHGQHPQTNPVIHAVFSLRSSLIDKCDEFFNGDVSAFLKALLLGYKSDLSDSAKANISRAGISHVISISGMHLSILMVLLNFFLSKLKRKFRFFIIPVANILFAVFVTMLTGGSPSVIRAALMLTLSSLTSLLYREPDPIQSLSFSVLVLTIINPCAVYDVRLILSAASVLGIVLIGEKVKSWLLFIKISTIRNILAATLSAQIFTLPLNVFFFNSISLLSVLANILILPFVPLLMGLGILFLLCPFAILTEFISGGIWLLIMVILDISKLISSVPISLVELSFHHFLAFTFICTVLLITAVFTMRSASAMKRMSYFAIYSLIITASFFLNTGADISLFAINLPHGEATLLKMNDGTSVLIDCGAAKGTGSDTDHVRSFLLKNGIVSPDYCILSSVSQSTVNSLISLGKSTGIKCVIALDYLTSENAFATKKLYDFLNDEGIPLYLLKKGDSFTPVDDIRFDFLLPEAETDYEDETANLVFSVTCGKSKILFTGNMSAYEKQLLIRGHTEINADIIKLADRGRHTYNDEAFIKMASPGYAYAFTNGPYPAKTEKILSRMGIRYFSTYTDKTIKMDIFKNGSIVIR